MQGKSQFLGHCMLSFFYDFVIKFVDSSAMYTDNVIMMRPAREFKNCLPASEIMSGDQSGRLELGKGAVDSGQANLLTSLMQFQVDILSGQMTVLSALEEFQHLDAWQGGFKAGALLTQTRLYPPCRPG